MTRCSYQKIHAPWAYHGHKRTLRRIPILGPARHPRDSQVDVRVIAHPTLAHTYAHSSLVRPVPSTIHSGTHGRPRSIRTAASRQAA
ncbi:hypothetical protein C2E23DRAFT_812242 [Lenzites betulinus]|nr:hypothetical protein C2E23DRAFT_812242 [Lenzites betulinus]